MNILYIHQHFSTPQGAAGQRSYEMAKRLIERGHQVTVICGHYQGGHTGLTNSFIKNVRIGDVEGIKIIEYKLLYSNYDAFIKRILTFFKFVLISFKQAMVLKYDLIFASSTPLTAAIPGICSKWFRRKAFVLEIRDLWPALPKAMGVIKNPVLLFLMKILEKISYRAADHIIALSPGMSLGIEACGIPREKITLISNGCDLDLFEQAGRIDRPKEVSVDDFMAIYTGTHGIANGLDALLDVGVELKKRQREDIKIVLYGDGKLKAALQAKAQRLGLNNVIFLPPMPKKDIASVMKIADLGLQILANVPAFYDGTSPNKFFDYLASGLPVLINYPGWLAEKIVEYNCGFVVTPHHPQMFADALEYAAAHRDDLVQKKQQAKALAKKEFDRFLLSEQWVDVLEKTFFKEKIIVAQQV